MAKPSKPASRRKPKPEAVKAAADRSEARARGETPTEPKVPIDPPVAPEAAAGEMPPEESASRDIQPHRIGAGRPTLYQERFVTIASKLCELGATDFEVAEALGVTDRTLYRWMGEHAEFCQAMKVGKDTADERVKRALYARAVGYSFTATKIMQNKGLPVVVEYVEHVPPDPNAAHRWLLNRDPENWKGEKLGLGVGEGGKVTLVFEA